MAEPIDLSQPLPDLAHESFRQAVVQAIEDINWTTADSGLGLDLIDTLFQLLETVQADIATLLARLDALAPHAPNL